MATTSGNLVADKALVSRSGGGKGSKGRGRLTAKLAAGVAVLGCAAALAFGALQAVDRTPMQTQPATVRANVALARTLAGDGYAEFSPGEAAVSASPASAAPSVARMRSLDGIGFLEFGPGEGLIVGTGTSSAPTGVGLREYLDGEGPVAALPLSSPSPQLVPLLGPQP